MRRALHLPERSPGAQTISMPSGKAKQSRSDPGLNSRTFACRADDSERARLITFSVPAMESLHQQLGSATMTILLVDRKGLILSLVGSEAALLGPVSARVAPPHVQRALRSAPAADGELADAPIGNAADGHRQGGNQVVMGVTTPILEPDGGTLCILDFRASPRDNLSHASALLRTTASIIEHRLIENDTRGFLLLRFHTRAGVLGSPIEALAIFDRDSRLVAANRVANTLLSIGDRRQVLRCLDCFETPWSGLVDHAELRITEPFKLRDYHGKEFFACASLPHGP